MTKAFSAILAAARFKQVAGVEINREVIRLAKMNAQINSVTNGEFFSGSADAIFTAVPFPGEKTTVLLDPPRTGAGKKFLQQLIAYAPRRIVYVACGPEAQADEIKVLLPNYAIESVQPIDLFPQTKHIENIVTLRLYE